MPREIIVGRDSDYLPIVMLKKDDAKSYARTRTVMSWKHYADMMDIEFTIQQGKLYMLQCRVGKRTAFAAIKIAVDMVGEKAHLREGSPVPDRTGSAESAYFGRFSTRPAAAIRPAAF